MNNIRDEIYCKIRYSIFLHTDLFFNPLRKQFYIFIIIRDIVNGLRVFLIKNYFFHKYQNE